MIVPMKKVLVVVQEKDADSAVAKLRAFGVLHPEHQKLPSGQDISALEDDIALLNHAVNILSEAEFSRAQAGESKELADWKFTAQHIVDMRKRIEQLKEYSLTLKNRISQWQPWGDFDPERVKSLSAKNIHIGFYQVPVKEIDNLPDNVVVKKVSVARGIANCAVISKEKSAIPYPDLNLPKTGLGEMQARLAEDMRVIESIKEEIKKHAPYHGTLLRARKLLEKELELCQARRGMGEVGSLAYLAGYIPSDTIERFLQISKKERWGAVISEPSEEDAVPTLIRNPRWVSIINPVFKLIEVVPGYREVDISLWFLIFFSVFFGMLIGDAAYGLVFFMLTFLAQKKWGRKTKNRSVFTLFYILSTCAIIWGVLSGTFFGQEWLSGWVRPLVPGLRDNNKVQALCFFLGALHLSIAHAWRGTLKLPSLQALSDAGWILILWAAFFLAKSLILGDRFPDFGVWLIISGAILVLFFTHPRKNIIKGVGQGLGNLLLNLINNFTDIVSYIRLFAVGLATVAVADSFNTMAMAVGFGNIFTGIITAFILLLGHGLNILLGPMSILVHGVRLNVLEFCNHLDVKWSGLSYQPLKEETAA